jgi:NAD-reducing hydrogenase small subunit
MNKPRLATVWLDGCSGCHMSLLDMDERILGLVEKVDVVYTPLMDIKTFPEGVDVTLVEGAVNSEEDYERIQEIRRNTKLLVALGDCSITANVPAMRNPFGPEATLKRAYLENATLQPQIPRSEVPPLLLRARPIHSVVKVDLYIQGCPPSADTIYFVLTELLEGRIPDLSKLTRFGA